MGQVPILNSIKVYFCYITFNDITWVDEYNVKYTDLVMKMKRLLLGALLSFANRYL